MSEQGITLMGVLVSIAIMGIMASLAMPSLDTLTARARQKEAKRALLDIQAAQLHHLYQQPARFFTFDRFGYMGGGSYNCDGSALPKFTKSGSGSDFVFSGNGCKGMRYSYQAFAKQQGSGGTGAAQSDRATDYIVIAHAPSDEGNRIMFGCEGAGSAVLGYATGDVWMVRKDTPPQLCRDVVNACNGGNANTGRCDVAYTGTKLAASYEWKLAPAASSGATGDDGAGKAYKIKLIIQNIEVTGAPHTAGCAGDDHLQPKIVSWQYLDPGDAPSFSDDWNGNCKFNSTGLRIPVGEKNSVGINCQKVRAYLRGMPQGDPCSNACNYLVDKEGKHLWTTNCKPTWDEINNTCELRIAPASFSLALTQGGKYSTLLVARVGSYIGWRYFASSSYRTSDGWIMGGRAKCKLIY